MHQKYSMVYLLTYLALITMYMFYMFFSCLSFSYTVSGELRLFIVSEFGFRVWNRSTALATMEYLAILLGKFPGIYFAPKYKPFYLLAYNFT